MKKIIFLTATFLGLISIIIGAFGSHGLNDYLISIEKMDTFEISVKFQFYHVFFLFILGLSYELFDKRFIHYAFYFCVIGVLLFSGSLYTLCFTNNSLFGIITPFGGVILLVAWSCFLLSIIQKQN